MTNDEARQFAEHWVNAWNKHDLEEVLSHYTDDFEMTTPMIQKVLGIAADTQRQEGCRGLLESGPPEDADLKFSLIDVTAGVDSVSLYYDAVLGKRAIETFFFNREGKVFKALATYN